MEASRELGRNVLNSSMHETESIYAKFREAGMEVYFPNEEEMEEYVESMQAVVNNTLGISAKILETDDYGYLKNPQEYTQPQEMRSVTVIIYSFCVVAVAVLITVYVLYRCHQKKTVSPQDEPSDLQNV